MLYQQCPKTTPSKAKSATVKMPLLAMQATAPLANSADSTKVGCFRTATLCSCRLEPADVAPCVKAANSGEFASTNLDSFCCTWSERLDIAATSMAGTGISYKTSQTLGPPETATTVSVMRPVTCRKPAWQMPSLVYCLRSAACLASCHAMSSTTFSGK